MNSFVFCTKACWPGVDTYLRAIESIVKMTFPGCKTEFFYVPANGFDAGLISKLKNDPPDINFVGGWDVGIRNIIINVNREKTRTFLAWCSPLSQTDLGMEIPLFLDVANFLKLNMLNYVSVTLKSDYEVLKNIHEGFVHSPICADFHELDKEKRQNIIKEEGLNCDIFCAPNSRKNIFMQIMALSAFEDIQVNFNYQKSEYIETAKRHLKKYKIHPWLKRYEYLEAIQKMDFGMQVSLSEGYNLATAEHMYYGIPVICSELFPYIKGNPKMDKLSVKDPTDCSEIRDKIEWITSLEKSEREAIGRDCHDVIVAFNKNNENIMSTLLRGIMKG